MIHPRHGLPDHLFNYISSITPLVNVDVLLANDQGRIALTWRDDKTYGPGWHVPGGIVRFKESILTRIEQVCLLELGISQISPPNLLQVNQIMNPYRDYRGHFISLLFFASTNEHFDESPSQPLAHGTLRSFTTPPENLIPQHKRYHSIIEALCLSSSMSLKSNSFADVAGNILACYAPLQEQHVLSHET